MDVGGVDVFCLMQPQLAILACCAPIHLCFELVGRLKERIGIHLSAVEWRVDARGVFLAFQQ